MTLDPSPYTDTLFLWVVIPLPCATICPPMGFLSQPGSLSAAVSVRRPDETTRKEQAMELGDFVVVTHPGHPMKGARGEDRRPSRGVSHRRPLVLV
jgi:hypothetical protein